MSEGEAIHFGVVKEAGDFALPMAAALFPQPLRGAVYYAWDHENPQLKPNPSQECRTAHGIHPDEVMKFLEHLGFESVEETFRNEASQACRRARERHRNWWKSSGGSRRKN